MPSQGYFIYVFHAHIWCLIPFPIEEPKASCKNAIRTPCCFHDGGHKANFLRNRNTREEKPTRACSRQEARALNKCDRHSRRRKPNKETTLRAANSMFLKGDEEVFSRWFFFIFKSLIYYSQTFLSNLIAHCSANEANNKLQCLSH